MLAMLRGIIGSLRWRIMVTYAAMVALVTIALSLYIISTGGQALQNSLERRASQEASLVAQALVSLLAGPASAQEVQTQAVALAGAIEGQVTVLGPGGVVLADSAEGPQGAPDQSWGPEVARALAGQVSVRWGKGMEHRVVIAAAPVVSGGRVVGVAAVSIPATEVDAALGRLRTSVALWALASTIIAFLLGVFVAGRVATYLRRIAQGASRIASGDLEYRLASDPLRESRAVAEAFNRMAESLKQLIEARSEERNRLAAVLSTMTDGVILVDRDGVIQLVNPAVGSLLELASPPQEGGRLISVVRDHEVQQLARLSLERHQVQQAQVEQPRTRRLLHVTAVPLSSAGGDGALLLLHDLTPARRLEVTRREFISNVSHELRTPLASVQAAVETLEDRALEDPVAARDFLRRIRSDVERMTRIVSDLLELSRLESGKSAVSLAPTDMVALLEEAVERFAPRAAAQGLKLRLEPPGSLPWVQADRYRLQGAVANLLDNAVKFTPAGGNITVSARHQGDWLQVQVRDTGIGIAPEHLPHVFERFYMVDRSSRQPGVGLGLSIAKHVVQAHGGTIQVESQEGAGSVFTLTIPVGAARS